jgi:hypothetical protein
MKVWTCWRYDDLEKIFDSEEKAVQWKKEEHRTLRPIDRWNDHTLTIEEVEVE